MKVSSSLSFLTMAGGAASIVAQSSETLSQVKHCERTDLVIPRGGITPIGDMLVAFEQGPPLYDQEQESLSYDEDTTVEADREMPWKLTVFDGATDYKGPLNPIHHECLLLEEGLFYVQSTSNTTQVKNCV